MTTYAVQLKTLVDAHRDRKPKMLSEWAKEFGCNRITVSRIVRMAGLHRAVTPGFKRTAAETGLMRVTILSDGGGKRSGQGCRIGARILRRAGLTGYRKLRYRVIGKCIVITVPKLMPMEQTAPPQQEHDAREVA